jgi:hypothetical protein
LAGEKVRNHCFFGGVDWEHLERISPTYVPVVKAELDDSHFERFEEEQETEEGVIDQEVLREY